MVVLAAVVALVVVFAVVVVVVVVVVVSDVVVVVVVVEKMRLSTCATMVSARPTNRSRSAAAMKLTVARTTVSVTMPFAYLLPTASPSPSPVASTSPSPVASPAAVGAASTSSMGSVSEKPYKPRTIRKCVSIIFMSATPLAAFASNTTLRLGSVVVVAVVVVAVVVVVLVIVVCVVVVVSVVVDVPATMNNNDRTAP